MFLLKLEKKTLNDKLLKISSDLREKEKIAREAERNLCGYRDELETLRVEYEKVCCIYYRNDQLVVQRIDLLSPGREVWSSNPSRPGHTTNIKLVVGITQLSVQL